MYIRDKWRSKVMSSTTSNFCQRLLSDKYAPRLASTDCLLHNNTTFAWVTGREVDKRVDQHQGLGWMAGKFDFQPFLSHMSYELDIVVAIRLLPLLLYPRSGVAAQPNIPKIGSRKNDKISVL